MESIEWFFNLVCHEGQTSASLTVAQHDKNKDGYLTKDEVIQLSESLLASATSRASGSSTDESSLSFETNLAMCISRLCQSLSSMRTSLATQRLLSPASRRPKTDYLSMASTRRPALRGKGQTRQLDRTTCPTSVGQLSCLDGHDQIDTSQILPHFEWWSSPMSCLRVSSETILLHRSNSRKPKMRITTSITRSRKDYWED